MLRNVVGSVVVLAVFCGLASAETLKGVRITKIADGKLTYATFDKETKKLGDAKELTIAKDVKVLVVGKDGAIALEGGLKSERLAKISEKGIGATLEVTDGTVTAISIQAPKKKDNQ